MTENHLPHRSPGDYVELAALLRLQPPDGTQIISPGDLLVIRFQPGRLTDEQFLMMSDILQFDFPELKFILIECDEAYLQSGGRVIIKRSSPPEEK